MFPTLKNAKLIFRHTDNVLVNPKTKISTNITSTELFHRKCDNKGPTITFVAANQGYIFGAYCPTSWIPSFSYSETKDAFLFCLRRPRAITDSKG